MSTVRLSYKTATHLSSIHERKIEMLLGKNWILSDEQKEIIREHAKNKFHTYYSYNTVNKLVEDKPHLYEFLPQDIKDKLKIQENYTIGLWCLTCIIIWI